MTRALTPEQKAAKQAARDRANEAAREAGQPTEAERANQAAIANPGAVRADQLKSPSRRDTVVVCCKLAVAYVDLRLFRPMKEQEQTQTGPREITVHRPTGEMVRIRGTAYPRGTPPAGFPAAPILLHGAAVTRNVSREFMDTWLGQNRQNPLVINGLIFVQPDLASARDNAEDLKDVRSGLEPIDPKDGKDRRIPRSTNAAITNVETESERAKAERQRADVSEVFEEEDV